MINTKRTEAVAVLYFLLIPLMIGLYVIYRQAVSFVLPNHCSIGMCYLPIAAVKLLVFNKYSFTELNILLC